jgi:hypothetical protein
MPNRESTMPFFALRHFLLSLVIAAGPTLLAGRLPLTNARIPWCALMEMGYPDPDLEAWRVLPSLAAPLLLDGTVTPVEAKDLVESSLARRLEDELVASHLYQSAIYRQQVDLLNESFDLGEVEDGSQGAVRRAEIKARLEQLETELEAHLRAGLAPSEKRLLQLGLLKEATEKALAAAAGNPERRARAQKNLRAAANRLRLAQDIHTALAARIPEAPWQDWRDGFGFKAVPEGVVLCLPGSWNPSLGGDARIIGYHHSRPGEPDSLIRLRMLRGIREQQDLVTFGVAEMDARRQRAADQAVRASAEQAKLEAEAELKRAGPGSRCGQAEAGGGSRGAGMGERTGTQEGGGRGQARMARVRQDGDPLVQPGERAGGGALHLLFIGNASGGLAPGGGNLRPEQACVG